MESNDFEITNGVLTRYYGNGKDVIIPEGVTGIGYRAFADRTSITSISVPGSVKDIDEFAFYSCTSLARVSLPDSITSIGRMAFYNCIRLTDVSIPKSITSIEPGTFYGCSCLTGISIPDGVTHIGNNAFFECRGLRDISIPESVEAIDSNAFSFCKRLKRVSVQGSVTSIGKSAFSDCTGLTDITVAGESIGESAFSDCTSLENVSISDGVTYIGEAAFRNCNLKSITIPKSVSMIDDCAFEGNKVDVIMYLCGPDHRIGYEDSYDTRTAYSIIDIGSQITFTDDSDKIVARIPLAIKGEYREAATAVLEAVRPVCFNGVRFDFEAYDKAWVKLEEDCNRTRIALARLQYPYELRDYLRFNYEMYVRTYGLSIGKTLIDENDSEQLRLLCDKCLLGNPILTELVEYASAAGKTEFSFILLDAIKNGHISDESYTESEFDISDDI